MKKLYALLPQKKKSSKAISLAELLVCIAIITFMASIALYHSGVWHKKILEIEILKLKTLIAHLQKKAQITNTTLTIRFDAANNKYWHEEKIHTLNTCLQFGYLEGTLGPPSNPTQPLTQSITFPDATIILYPDGTISAGTIYCITKNKQAMIALTCGVSELSYIRIYHGNLPGWKIAS